MPSTGLYCFGSYKVAPNVTYNCSFGLVSFNYSSLFFTDKGNSNISVRGAPTETVPELVGTINCNDSVFSAGATFSGSCNEIYMLSGKFDSDTTWHATLKVTFIGNNCLDCVNQTFTITGTTNHISDIRENNLPNEYKLFQNYPNPFNPSTTIKYSITELGKVKLSLINLLGEVVSTLINDEKNAGNHLVELDASKLTSGVYFYQLKTREYSAVRKMILLK